MSQCEVNSSSIFLNCDSLLKGSGVALSVGGGSKRRGLEALGVLFNTLLPLYGFLFTLVFFSVGLNNYHHPDIRDKMFC